MHATSFPRSTQTAVACLHQRPLTLKSPIILLFESDGSTRRLSNPKMIQVSGVEQTRSFLAIGELTPLVAFSHRLHQNLPVGH
jgi:Flp pilus assembly secretin CpaC